jgi:hypothetical protein
MPTGEINPQYAAIFLLVGLQFLVSIGTGISTIINNNKRKPSLDQEVYRDFVRRQELEVMRVQFVDQVRALDDRHQATAAEIFDVLRRLKDDLGRQSTHIESSLNGVANQLGKIDGRLQGHIEAEKKST